jgi:hypothetical protein
LWSTCTVHRTFSFQLCCCMLRVGEGCSECVRWQTATACGAIQSKIKLHANDSAWISINFGSISAIPNCLMETYLNSEVEGPRAVSDVSSGSHSFSIETHTKLRRNRINKASWNGILFYLRIIVLAQHDLRSKHAWELKNGQHASELTSVGIGMHVTTIQHTNWTLACWWCNHSTRPLLYI